MKKDKNINPKALKNIFQSEPRVRLAYLFGSAVAEEKGPLSDYDFAVYFGEKNSAKNAAAQIRLIVGLSEALGTDKIDVAVLDNIENPELKYNIIKEGRVIFEKGPARVILEPGVMNEYFDFHLLLLRNNLTKSP